MFDFLLGGQVENRVVGQCCGRGLLNLLLPQQLCPFSGFTSIPVWDGIHITVIEL